MTKLFIHIVDLYVKKLPAKNRDDPTVNESEIDVFPQIHKPTKILHVTSKYYISLRNTQIANPSGQILDLCVEKLCFKNHDDPTATKSINLILPKLCKERRTKNKTTKQGRTKIKTTEQRNEIQRKGDPNQTRCLRTVNN